MSHVAIVSGFVETSNGLESFEVLVDNDNDIMVIQNGEIRDDLNDICEFCEETSGMYYKTKAAFKNSDYEDLSLAILRHVLDEK